jgi:hypothetical protein
MKKKIGKMDLAALEKQLILLEDEQKSSILGGSYYYDNNTGAFLGSTTSGNSVRFINSSEWAGVESNNLSDAGIVFTDVQSDNGFARFNLLKSLLPPSAANVTIRAFRNRSVAGFLDGVFYFDPDSTLFNDYNNLQSIMFHESCHWDNGQVIGTSNYSGYSTENEIETIMSQISQSEYNNTTNEFRIYTANYLYNSWPNKGQSGYTSDDAYRIAKVDGYSESGYVGYGYAGYGYGDGGYGGDGSGYSGNGYGESGYGGYNGYE